MELLKPKCIPNSAVRDWFRKACLIINIGCRLNYPEKLMERIEVGGIQWRQYTITTTKHYSVYCESWVNLDFLEWLPLDRVLGLLRVFIVGGSACLTSQRVVAVIKAKRPDKLLYSINNKFHSLEYVLLYFFNCIHFSISLHQNRSCPENTAISLLLSQ
jgi:hypothetical protein